MEKPRSKSKLSKKNLTLAHKVEENVSTSTVRAAPAGINHIRVVVRVRGCNYLDLQQIRNVIKVTGKQSLVFDPSIRETPFFYDDDEQCNWDIPNRPNKNLLFTFNRVFGHNSYNREVFEESIKGLTENLMKGHNYSVFVYGGTGTGKTHTMLGSLNDPGLAFQMVLEIFKLKDELSNEREFQIGLAYLEVYNETIQDLLNPGWTTVPRSPLRVLGLEVYPVHSIGTLFQMILKGNHNRTRHSTNSNSGSSCSHAVLQVYLEMQVKSTGEVQCSKLSMIDLAGRETDAATVFTKSSTNTNKALLAFENCVNSLANGRTHAPYHDSKLTLILKDSLGGDCNTVIIANVSPSSSNFEATYHTLKFATKAKKIKSNIMINDFSPYLELVETERLKEVPDLSTEALHYCNETDIKPVASVSDFGINSTDFPQTVKEEYEIEEAAGSSGCISNSNYMKLEKPAKQLTAKANVEESESAKSDEQLETIPNFEEQPSYMKSACQPNLEEVALYNFKISASEKSNSYILTQVTLAQPQECNSSQIIIRKKWCEVVNKFVIIFLSKILMFEVSMNIHENKINCVDHYNLWEDRKKMSRHFKNDIKLFLERQINLSHYMLNVFNQRTMENIEIEFDLHLQAFGAPIQGIYCGLKKIKGESKRFESLSAFINQNLSAWLGNYFLQLFKETQ